MTGIVNYGVGNIYSVVSAVKKCGEESFIIEKPSDFLKADKIILPGVGAFGKGIQHLQESGIKTALFDIIKTGKPFLGICLGMQILFSYSEEGDCEGLNLIKGNVRKFVFQPFHKMKVPHMGLSIVKIIEPGKKLFNNIPDNMWFYFAHSYYVIPEESTVIAATTNYGYRFVSAVKMNNIVGVQFHPEKSGDCGLIFLKNFLEGRWLL